MQTGSDALLRKVVFCVLCRLYSLLVTLQVPASPGVSSSRVATQPLHGCVFCPWTGFAFQWSWFHYETPACCSSPCHPIRACPSPELQLGDARGPSWRRRDSPDEAAVCNCRVRVTGVGTCRNPHSPQKAPAPQASSASACCWHAMITTTSIITEKVMVGVGVLPVCASGLRLASRLDLRKGWKRNRRHPTHPEARVPEYPAGIPRPVMEGLRVIS